MILVQLVKQCSTNERALFITERNEIFFVIFILLLQNHKFIYFSLFFYNLNNVFNSHSSYNFLFSLSLSLFFISFFLLHLHLWLTHNLYCATTVKHQQHSSASSLTSRNSLPSFRFHKSDQDTLEEIPHTGDSECDEDELTTTSEINTVKHALNIQGICKL